VGNAGEHPPILDGMAAPVPALDDSVVFERTELDERSWFDLARGWVTDSGEVYDALTGTIPWRQGSVYRYEKYRDEPRVSAWCPSNQPVPHPVFKRMQQALQQRYRVFFDGFALSWYRDGNDCVGFHRDSDLRYCENTVIAIATFGAQRPWLLRPTGARNRFTDELQGATHDLAPAGGDLLVMGGRSQRGWEHSVPMVRGAARAKAGRISASWRWTSRTGKPEIGPGSRAPLLYSNGGRA
jgi:alkylated DNA repair dioxygenase AlkB